MTLIILLIVASLCTIAAYTEFDDGRAPLALVDELYSEEGRKYLRDGVFRYRGDAQRGPSVLVDARGLRKRWPNSSEAPRMPEGSQSKHKRQFP